MMIGDADEADLWIALFLIEFLHSKFEIHILNLSLSLSHGRMDCPVADRILSSSTSTCDATISTLLILLTLISPPLLPVSQSVSHCEWLWPIESSLNVVAAETDRRTDSLCPYGLHADIVAIIYGARRWAPLLHQTIVMSRRWGQYFRYKAQQLNPCSRFKLVNLFRTAYYPSSGSLKNGTGKEQDWH